MLSSIRNQILDSLVSALQAISGAPSYFYSVAPQSVSRILKPVDRISSFPALFVTEGNETRRWETVGPQLLSSTLDLVIWGYARADGSVASSASAAKEALLHDVDVAVATAFKASQLSAIVDIAPAGNSILVQTDEGIAAFYGAPDIGVFKIRIPVIFRQAWGQP